MINIGSPISKEHNFLKKIFYNEPLFETHNFIVIPSLGSLVEGWLMIVPKEYYISFGAIRNQTIYKELDHLIENLGQLTKAIYGDFVLFEHGPIVKNSPVGCSIDYAHLHLVPVCVNLIEMSKFFLSKEISWCSVPGIHTTSEYFNKNIPYLFVRDVDKKNFVGFSEELPSQLFRRTIAKHIGIEEKYDWKRFPFTENIDMTIKSMSIYKKELFKT
jgi:ATP adenylyltransferase